MNKKEIAELSRRWKPGKNAVSHIYGCFVAGNSRQIIADIDEGLGLMPVEEAELYFGLLRKTLSGAQGRNLMDIVFATSQVADGEEHRLLMALRNSGLQDADVRRSFYQKVIDCLDMDGESYLILMASDSYDVPHRGKDDELQPDASDEVFKYILCVVCPVKESKLSLSYYPGDNEFHISGGRQAGPPELGFLFPAFDDRSPNIYNALFYTRSPDQVHQEFVDGVFHTEPIVSAAEQRESFHSALTDALGAGCSLDVVQGVHEQLTEKIELHKENRDPEPLTLTSGDVGKMLKECGVPAERVTSFETYCTNKLGEGAALTPANLMDPGHFEVKTAEARIIVDPASAHLVETRTIDGKRYILVPAEEELEVNGITVQFSDSKHKPLHS